MFSKIPYIALNNTNNNNNNIYLNGLGITMAMYNGSSATLNANSRNIIILSSESITKSA